MENKEMTELCSIENSLIECAQSSKSKFDCIDNLQEFAEVMDAIKDIAEAKKCCAEAEYYCSVTKAMKEYGEEPYRMGYPMNHEPMYYDRMGYNNRRYASSGRYASEGHGERMGYENPEYTGGNDRRYGYDQGRNGGNRMGYRPSRYGMHYEQYRDTRRHYTETNDQADLQKMSQKAQEHLDSVSESLRDMWNDADQQTRDKIRQTVSQLAAELN